MSRPSGPTVVVGAGPAGAAAAIAIARAGRPVVLVDKARFPRDKSCGDGLTGPAIRELSHLGVEPARLESWRWAGQSAFVSPRGRELPMATGGEQPLLAVARRWELDAALVGLARSAGAEVREGWNLASAALSGGELALRSTDGEELLATHAIGADGAWSPLRRALNGSGTSPRLSKWHAARVYVPGVTGRGAVEARVWFEPDLLPGYAWSFPLGDGSANVGLGALRSAGDGSGWIVRRMHRLLEEKPVRNFLAGHPELATRPMVWPIPTRLRRARLAAAGGRVLFAGDAAGATDPMTGEGIAEALETGRLAGEAIVAGTPAGYVRLAGRRFAGRHRRRELCSTLLRAEVLAEAGIRVAGLNPWATSQFTRWVFD